MKKTLDLLPFALLLTLVPFLFYSTPNIAQSIIIGVISALSGLKYYLIDKELPNYEKMFKEQLDIQSKETKEELKFIKAELANIREKYGKVSLEQQQVKKASNFNW